MGDDVLPDDNLPSRLIGSAIEHRFTFVGVPRCALRTQQPPLFHDTKDSLIMLAELIANFGISSKPLQLPQGLAAGPGNQASTTRRPYKPCEAMADKDPYTTSGFLWLWHL